MNDDDRRRRGRGEDLRLLAGMHPHAAARLGGVDIVITDYAYLGYRRTGGR